LGRPEEAMNHIKIALELDPFNPQIKAFYGIDLMFVHKFDEAVKAFQEALELSPYHLVAYGNMVDALFFAGKEYEAIDWLRTTSKDPEFLKAVDEGSSEAGFAGAMKKLADLYAERSKSIYIGPRRIGQLYVLAGDTNNAIIWLEKAYNEHDKNLPYVLKPEYDIIREDLRFQDLCRRMNLPYKIN
jgi:tetratricopeptide (TPR) repeat protein